jgi:hypothetical protein
MDPIVQEIKVLNGERLTGPLQNIVILIAPVTELTLPTATVDDGQRADVFGPVLWLIVTLLEA